MFPSWHRQIANHLPDGSMTPRRSALRILSSPVTVKATEKQQQGLAHCRMLSLRCEASSSPSPLSASPLLLHAPQSHAAPAPGRVLAGPAGAGLPHGAAPGLSARPPGLARGGLYRSRHGRSGRRRACLRQCAPVRRRPPGGARALRLGRQPGGQPVRQRMAARRSVRDRPLRPLTRNDRTRRPGRSSAFVVRKPAIRPVRRIRVPSRSWSFPWPCRA